MRGGRDTGRPNSNRMAFALVTFPLTCLAFCFYSIHEFLWQIRKGKNRRTEKSKTQLCTREKGEVEGRKQKQSKDNWIIDRNSPPLASDSFSPKKREKKMFLFPREKDKRNDGLIMGAFFWGKKERKRSKWPFYQSGERHETSRTIRGGILQTFGWSLKQTKTSSKARIRLKLLQTLVNSTPNVQPTGPLNSIVPFFPPKKKKKKAKKNNKVDGYQTGKWGPKSEPGLGLTRWIILPLPPLTRATWIHASREEGETIFLL